MVEMVELKENGLTAMKSGVKWLDLMIEEIEWVGMNVLNGLDWIR